MPYPNFANKHLEKSLFLPENYIKWTKYKEKQTGKPKKYILLYYPYLIKHFQKNYKSKKIKLYRLITIHQHKNIGVVMMTGIGSPNATTVLEELIALGGREFINIGSCGGLDNFGVYLCTKAVRDEGTSHHYLPKGRFSFPDEKLTKKLGISITKQGLEFEEGPTWTIDAPYRETISEVRHYKKLGVKTVEMEASALFAVANVRKVKIASAFVVSDVLGEDKWNPQFGAKFLKQKLRKLLDASVDCFSN